MTVPLHILSGFLGTGKTTTLVHLLSALQDREKVAVVINDFGEAAIDSTLAGSEQVALDEIRGACVCCTAPAGFQAAVGRLLDEESPDRIFVEPTGLAHPADLIDTLRRAPYADQLDVRPLIVLLDPTSPVRGVPVARAQLEAADILVATKTDLASEDQLRAVRELAESVWPGPMATYEIAHGELPLEVLELQATDDREHDEHDHGHHEHDHGHVFRSWIWDADMVFHRERLTDVLARLATGQAGAPLARLKGLFRTEEGVFNLQVAGGRVHEDRSAYRRDSRVDVILGTEDGDEAFETLDEWFALARLTEEEQQQDDEVLEVVVGGERQRFDRFGLRSLPGGVDDIQPMFPRRAGEAARVAAVLDAAAAPAKGEAVVVASDGYATPPVDLAVFRQGIVLHSLKGAPLPRDKGGPLRLLIPDDAGPAGPCSNVKGLVRIVVRTSGE